MFEAVVFNGANALDFIDIRRNVIRIPQVSARLSEAQRIWDQWDESGFSLHNFLLLENEEFLSDQKRKSLAAAVVQLGLLDRYLESYSPPQFWVGVNNSDSALHVVTRQKTFAQMILESPALDLDDDKMGPGSKETPVLSGISLAEYACYRSPKEDSEETQEFLPVEVNSMDINKVVRQLIDDEAVTRFVSIGPGSLLLSQAQQDLALMDIQILESIDLDPLLNWFWPTLRRQQMAL